MDLLLFVVAVCIFIWFTDNGPQKFMNKRLQIAEANARAEQARLERVRLENRYDR